MKKICSSFDAAKLAIEATERFFNDLRKEIGDGNFDRLFLIHPTEKDLRLAQVSIAERKQFHFLTSTVFGIKDPQTPTYDLSDEGISKSDTNIHAGSLLIDDSKTFKTRYISRRRHSKRIR